MVFPVPGPPQSHKPLEPGVFIHLVYVGWSISQSQVPPRGDLLVVMRASLSSLMLDSECVKGKQRNGKGILRVLYSQPAKSGSHLIPFIYWQSLAMGAEYETTQFYWQNPLCFNFCFSFCFNLMWPSKAGCRANLASKEQSGDKVNFADRRSGLWVIKMKSAKRVYLLLGFPNNKTACDTNEYMLIRYQTYCECCKNYKHKAEVITFLFLCSCCISSGAP